MKIWYFLWFYLRTRMLIAFASSHAELNSFAQDADKTLFMYGFDRMYYSIYRAINKRHDQLTAHW